MPYTKKRKTVASFLKAYRKKKAPYKKKTSRAKGNVGKATSLIRTGGRSVKVRSVNELKDVTGFQNAVLPLATTTAAVALINGIAQGTGAGERIGRKVTMKSLFIRGYVAKQGATVGSVPIRILIVYDKQTNATLPATTDVVVTDTVMAPMNLANAQRFTVLYDRVFNLGEDGDNVFNFSKYIKMNHDVTYNAGTTNTIGSIQTGSVISFVWSNGGLGGAAPAHAIWTRFRYTD